MKNRLTLAIFVLTIAGLACNLPASTPPVAASPSPTLFIPPAATANVTPLAPARAFFEENFNTDVTDWSALVTSGDVDLLDLRVQKGFWVFDIGGRDLNALAFYQPNIYKNVRMDFRVKDQGGTAHAIHAVCRYTKEEGWYQFEIFNSGLYNLYYFVWDEDMKPKSTLLLKGASDAMREGLAGNEFSVICNERALTLYVNGQMAASYVDNQYVLRAGQIGLGVSSFEQLPVRVEFDWVKFVLP